MADLQADQFREFFQELHGKQPFPWQEALAQQVCISGWPKVIDLPTASGKTACIDIALFALAVSEGKDAPRRIFFVVDRRVVVNEAYLRMCRVRCALKKARDGVLGSVAENLRRLANGNRSSEDGVSPDPLFVYEMRGGAFRDETWVRNPLQPTVITSTVDQVGSRLLFRGYGVGENSWPLHAGLIGNDALIFLDEAHCSRAFAQTLKSVERYRGEEWASHPLRLPFHVVEMTATPAQEAKPEHVFRLTKNDRNEDVLRQRLQATKPSGLVEIPGKKDDIARLASALIDQAEELAKAADAKRVAIFANRVKTAKQVYQQIRKRMEGTAAQIELVIGSMRAVDRDDLYDSKLRHLKSGEERKPEDLLTFVVSTQCLEVGADLDFDVLVSECASIDALQQRFGRLDRLGEFKRARGAIVIAPWQVDLKQPDPVYGEALSQTWKWLKGIAGKSSEINMGIESRAGEPQTIRERLADLDEEQKKKLHLQTEDAPVLLPAHVDMLAQTSPVPAPSPLVEFFLHGPKRGDADVQVVWRNDLEDARDEEEEIEIVKLCPPSSRETMSVPISAFKRWFAGEKDAYEQESDLETGVEEEKAVQQEQQQNKYALIWMGDESRRTRKAKDIKPGQTLILRASLEGWDDLGHIPEGSQKDVGDRAAFGVRNGVSLRLHPEVMKEWPETPVLQSLVEYVKKDGAEQGEIEELLRQYRTELQEGPLELHRWPYELLENFGKLRRKDVETYPEQSTPYVLRARRSESKRGNGGQVFLEDHLDHVQGVVSAIASGLDNDLQDAMRKSARFHDYGKVDVRFQAWLRNGDQMAARYALKPIAKSGNDVLLQQRAVGLPKDFRHELLSLMFAERSPEVIGGMRDLILHLIATHHGRCRPFAPVVLDDGAECITYDGIAICKMERIENAPHRLDSGVSDRFWHLTAQYGWWGLAYLEALLRLADWQASEDEAAEVSYE